VSLKIAIIMATHNGECFIRQQIESIVNQDYEDWFLYFSDDASQDSTLDILQSFCDKYPQKMKIINYTLQFGNARDNFFYLIEHINADLYFFSDQDDFWMPNKISFFLNSYNKLSTLEQRNPILMYSDLFVVDSNMRTLSNSFFRYQRLNPNKNKVGNLLVQNCIVGCSMVINKELKKLFSVKCIDNIDREKIIMHDWYFALIAAEFGIIKFINKPLVKYRQHQKNILGAKNVRSNSYIKYKLLNINSIAEDIEKTKWQADVFRKNYFGLLSKKTNKMIINFIDIHKYNFLSKILFLLRYNMLKHGITRIIGQFLFS